MSIRFDEDKKIFFLTTKNSEYQIKIDEFGMLFHTYYGGRVGETDMSYLFKEIDRGFSGNNYEYRDKRGISPDTLPMEFSTYGAGDYRVSALETVASNGSRTSDLRYSAHRIYKGKYTIPELPYVRGKEDKVDTLEIDLLDEAIGLKVTLYYGVFEEKDILTRTAGYTNQAEGAIVLNKASSLSMDFANGSFDMIHFHGRHAFERIPERVSLSHDIHKVSSKRGASSHHNNPFIILCDNNATEDAGNCYGFMLAYSGNHSEEVEVDQAGSTRVICGIGSDNFSWNLGKNDIFYAPEAILAYSNTGLNDLSYLYHKIIRENICPEKFKDVKRPVLLNNWEGTYFDFDEKSIMEIEDAAAEMGCEMLVLDDGWFGERNSDNAGLGDWFVNDKKLPGGLKVIADHANKLGMKFGLWFEPEMINEDSELFRMHPEWALRDPDRNPVMGRNQLVLDMSNKEVVDYLFDSISKVLDSAHIEYVKWDFNRSMSNVYSNAHGALEQGEINHRFVLGTYKLLERLTDAYPDIMIEGCSGGGGRFDAGMLFYCPQIWCSDNTDAIDRLTVQKGTSYGYPVSTMGAHVSVSPNHQNGRVVPIKTRAVVAMSGTFGYELDPRKLSADEKGVIRGQIKTFNSLYELIQKGRYYRLGGQANSGYFEAWQYVSEDKKEALLNLVVTNVRANSEIPFVKLKGIDSCKKYRITCVGGTEDIDFEGTVTGSALINGGLSLPPMSGVYPSVQLHIAEA